MGKVYLALESERGGVLTVRGPLALLRELVALWATGNCAPRENVSVPDETVPAAEQAEAVAP